MTLEPAETVSRADLDTYVAMLEQVAREAYSEPELVRSSPHRSTVHQIDAGALDDPERWALTWRARQRKQAASPVEPGVTSG